MDVALVTQKEYLKPKIRDQFHLNIFKENKILQAALESKGLKVRRVAWDDSNFDWSTVKCALIRETWDYFYRIDEFKCWLTKASNKTALINPYSQLLWNMDKHYLHELLEMGINIPETVFVEMGDKRSLKDLFEETGWHKAVVKPAISGSSRHTYSLRPENVEEHEKIYRDLIQSEAMLFQRFQENVVKQGEKTFVLISGKYTHGILKRAKSGDFRVQDDFGGTVQEYFASKEEIAFVEKVMSKIVPTPLYGRVDVILDQFGEMAVQEVELIEPELWFRYNEDASECLAEEVASYLK